MTNERLDLFFDGKETFNGPFAISQQLDELIPDWIWEPWWRVSGMRHDRYHQIEVLLGDAYDDYEP